MKEFLHRLKLVGLACALTAGLGVGATATITALTAAPASAANGSCFDMTNSQPTPLHYDPSKSSRTVKFLRYGYTVTGPCVYWDNTYENRWYMQVNYIGPNNHNGYGFIWVQRLDFGSGHDCKDDSGQVASINTYYPNIGIPCPLNYYS